MDDRLALGLQHYAEILLLIARGQPVPLPGQSTGFDEPQLLRRAIHAITIKQSKAGQAVGPKGRKPPEAARPSNNQGGRRPPKKVRDA